MSEQKTIETISPYVYSMDWEGYEIKMRFDGEKELPDNYHSVINVSESKTTEIWLNGFPRKLLSQVTVVTANCKNIVVFKYFMEHFKRTI
jgi:hypothetical protein